MKMSKEEVIDTIKNSTLADCYDFEDALTDRMNDLYASDRRPIEKGEGELMTLEEMRSAMICCAITRSDGIGRYATETEVSQLPFKFYDMEEDEKMKKYGFTRIMWYNK